MTTDLVPFGKYAGAPLATLLADRPYCEWLRLQPWVATQAPQVYAAIIRSIGRTIYMAGSIGGRRGARLYDWRCPLVAHLTAVQSWGQEGFPPQWPVLFRAILGRFDYVGPYFTRFEWHSRPTHGVWLEDVPWNHCGDTPYVRTEVTRLCLDAVARADLVFAWIDTPDCYGTLFELGYAKALGKRCAVYFPQGNFYGTAWDAHGALMPDGSDFAELWFAYFATNGEDGPVAATPRSALEDALTRCGWLTRELLA